MYLPLGSGDSPEACGWVEEGGYKENLRALLEMNRCWAINQYHLL